MPQNCAAYTRKRKPKAVEILVLTIRRHETRARIKRLGIITHTGYHLTKNLNLLLLARKLDVRYELQSRSSTRIPITSLKDLKTLGRAHLASKSLGKSHKDSKVHYKHLLNFLMPTLRLFKSRTFKNGFLAVWANSGLSLFEIRLGFSPLQLFI